VNTHQHIDQSICGDASRVGFGKQSVSTARYAVDTETEVLIQEAFARLITNRTAIVVAHRLSTIRKADQIVVLRAGEIQELGNHETLVQIPDGYYVALVKAQASGGH